MSPLPVIVTHNEKSRRRMLDLHGLARQIADGPVITCAFLEEATCRPLQSATSTFKCGIIYGAIYGLLVGMRLSIKRVRPQEWQKHYGIGGDPDQARRCAIELFPTLADRFVKKRDEGLADAILIANYGNHWLSTSDLPQRKDPL